MQSHIKVVEVAERYGVSRQAVHGWLRRYAADGLDELADPTGHAAARTSYPPISRRESAAARAGDRRTPGDPGLRGS
jgi:transposase